MVTITKSMCIIWAPESFQRRFIMRIQTSAVILLFVALILSACRPAVKQTEADVAAIQALVEAWGAAIEAGDVAGVVALYTDDIVRMPPDAPAIRGKQGHRGDLSRCLRAVLGRADLAGRRDRGDHRG